MLTALGDTGAQAHAFLDHASPLVGSTVPTAPRELTLSFTQNLEAAFSTVQVTGPNGARVDQGKPQISGNTMRVGIKAAGPGNLSRALARALGRYPHDGGKLHLSRRRAVSVSSDRADSSMVAAPMAATDAAPAWRMTDPLFYARAVHFAATIMAAGVVFFVVFIAEPALRKAQDAARLAVNFRRGSPGSHGSVSRYPCCQAQRGLF